MLQAVMADIAQLPDHSVVTTLEAALLNSFDNSGHGEVIAVESPAQEAMVFQQLLQQVDAALIIAPETGGILADRCRQVLAARVASWNCTPAAIELCGDKWQLANHLRTRDLPTIPTRLADLDRLPSDESWPLVLKPRDGAGSHLIFLVRSPEEWQRAVESIRAAEGVEKCLVQPFVAGRALSIGVNISHDGRRIVCLPVGEQRLSDDGRFHYLGGIIPASIAPVVAQSIERLVLEACQSIPGLVGYIGLDLLLTADGNLLIVEINPRLTTAYVGYRQLYAAMLPRLWNSANPSDVLGVQRRMEVEFVVS